MNLFKQVNWLILSQIGSKVLSFTIQIYIARLLSPYEIGLVAIALIFSNLGETITDSGLRLSLIRSKKVSALDLSTIYYTNLIVALVIYLLIFLIAPFISNQFNEPELINIVYLITLIIPIKSFSIVHDALLIRKINFKKQAIIELTGSVFASITALILINLNGRIYSLVAFYVVQAFVVTLGYIYQVKWKPQLLYSFKVLKKHYLFSLYVLSSTLINLINYNLYTYLIGLNFSLTSLGYYNRASVYNNFLSNTISQIANKATYPIFAKDKENIVVLDNIQTTAKKLISIFYFPLILYVFINIEQLIILFLTEKWLPLTIYFRILTIVSILKPFETLSINLITALGKPQIISRTLLILRIISIIGIFMFLDRELIYIVFYEIFCNLILIFIMIHLKNKELKTSFFARSFDIQKLFLTAVSATVLSNFLIGHLNLEIIWNLMLQVFLCLILYCFALYKVQNPTFLMIFNKIFNK